MTAIESLAIVGATPFDAGSTSDGVVVVDGVVDGPAGDTRLESGMSGTPCVAYSERRITKKSHGNRDVSWAPRGTYRRRVNEETGSVPFVIPTDEGSVRVAASDARVEVNEDDYAPVSIEEVRENRGLLVGVW